MTLEPKPFWMERAEGWLGVHETEKRAEEIAKGYSEATGRPFFDPDETAWCSIFVGYALGGERFDLTGITEMAKSWLTFKSAQQIERAADARHGDIVIFDRGSDPRFGHVGFFAGLEGDKIKVLGGNQSDRVSIARYAGSRLRGIRRPLPSDGVSLKPAPDKHDGSDFDRALPVILRLEGGWSDRADDLPTNLGITLPTLQDWYDLNDLGNATKAKLKALTESEATQIYRGLYWDRAKCDALDSGALRLMHFDAAVNKGVTRSVVLLQTALNGVGASIDVDGQFGPLTAKAEDAADQAELLIEYAAQRAVFYAGLSKFKTFGLGWSRRLSRVHDIGARELAGLEAPAPAPQPEPASTLPADPAAPDTLSAVPTTALLAALWQRPDVQGFTVTKP